MQLIDTHTHIYDERFAIDYSAAVRRAVDAGVSKLYMPNCDSSTLPVMHQMADNFPQHCLPMTGLHPVYVNDGVKAELDIIAASLRQRKYAAIGEIGLDHHWDKTFVVQQQYAFEQQITWALEYQLPIVIHSREATQLCIDTVKKHQRGNLRGIFHCFGGSAQEARQIIDLGFLLGIGGVLTYKNSGLSTVLTDIPLSSLVLETDAPYLAPVPYRGKPNDSSYLPLIAHKLAEVKAVSVEEVAAITTANAQQLFAI